MLRWVDGAWNAIAGSEAMNIIRNGQSRWLPTTDTVGQERFIERTLASLHSPDRCVSYLYVLMCPFATLPSHALSCGMPPVLSPKLRTGSPICIRLIISNRRFAIGVPDGSFTWRPGVIVPPPLPASTTGRLFTL